MESSPTNANGFNAAARAIHEVDPDRFAFGEWIAHENRHVGEGDIYASYSADRIAVLGKVRKPFQFRGRDWVCTSNCFEGLAGNVSTAYRLVAIEAFEGEPVSYEEKARDCAVARRDPDGFYHSIKVQHRGQDHVLCGPPVHFIPAPPKPPVQPCLFSS